MQIIDQKFRKNLFNYVFQCFLATAILIVALLFLNIVTETALIASLGATAFIIFAMPKTYAAAPRRVIGGYSIGIITGITCFYLGQLLQPLSPLNQYMNHNSPIILAATAVGLSIFFMVLTDTEHAPAAGISLGLVINQWDESSVAFIIGVMLAMTIIKYLLKAHFINLTSPDLEKATK
ncbi:MAG: HPP family protein [Candidatus Thermoplasmatota archaeon]|nr:HPP family protein [Candidatus Thermoplasmatota archaeon]